MDDFGFPFHYPGELCASSLSFFLGTLILYFLSFSGPVLLFFFESVIRRPLNENFCVSPDKFSLRAGSLSKFSFGSPRRSSFSFQFSIRS